tara:strand:+ start:150730 stop:151323 length:594 start_codon:yes stop_codon:yes gene_type:complete
MEKFTKLKGIAAPLLVKNIDTDQIIPKQFLTTVKREGLAKGLFYDWRFNVDGITTNTFVLNQPEFKNACILLADENFGCGSSREHAPWALLDFGIRCVIAPSFADIFSNNCTKNGILTIQLSIEDIEEIATASPTHPTDINLEEQCIKCGNLKYSFNIDADVKNTLMQGLDDIALTQNIQEKITDYEAQIKKLKPWL